MSPQTTELGWRSTFVDGYLEDTIKFLPNLEVRAGIRTESTDGWNASHGRAAIYGFTNGVINTTPTIGSSALTNNRAKLLPEPRLGLSYDPFSTGKTVIRASVGLHHALLDTLDYRLDQSAPFNTVYSIKNSTVTNPTGGTQLHLAFHCPAGHPDARRHRLDLACRAADRAQHLAHRRLRRLARLSPDPLRGPERASVGRPAERHHLLPHDDQGQPSARQHDLMGLAGIELLQRS